MIKIITEDGISLDLAPDAEFAIEYNNPMFEDDRIPVPFSTSIALLPSATNCKVFQYLPALKLEPAVKKLAASIVFNGIPFLTGILIYDGIEEGNLNYTFAGRDLEEEWGKKIYELRMSSSYGVDSNQFCWPLLVNKDETGYFVKDCDNLDKSDTYNNQRQYVESNVKYHNFPFGDNPRRTPAIYASAITDRVELDSDEDIKELYQHIAVLGNGSGRAGRYMVGHHMFTTFAGYLPDITIVEFVQGICRMFCAAVFEDGGRIIMKSIHSILGSNAGEDWSSKVSDDFSSGIEECCGYKFGYENSGEDSVNCDSASIDLFKQSKTPLFVTLWIAEQPATLGILPYKIKSTGDIVSVCTWGVNYDIGGSSGKAAVAAADIVFQNNIAKENVVSDADTVDNSCPFNLVKSVPSILTRPKSQGALLQRCSMAAITEPINEEAERRADVYVGLVVNGQMTDSGHALSSRTMDVPITGNSEDEDICLTLSSGERASLRPDWLYEHFHERYAQWLATDRQVITCDVNLNEFDLLSFRMYNKVRLHGRDFFVKKLSVTLRAGSEALECSADFISA